MFWMLLKMNGEAPSHLTLMLGIRKVFEARGGEWGGREFAFLCGEARKC